MFRKGYVNLYVAHYFSITDMKIPVKEGERAYFEKSVDEANTWFDKYYGNYDIYYGKFRIYFPAFRKIVRLVSQKSRNKEVFEEIVEKYGHMRLGSYCDALEEYAEN